MREVFCHSLLLLFYKGKVFRFTYRPGLDLLLSITDTSPRTIWQSPKRSLLPSHTAECAGSIVHPAWRSINLELLSPLITKAALEERTMRFQYDRKSQDGAWAWKIGSHGKKSYYSRLTKLLKLKKKNATNNYITEMYI